MDVELYDVSPHGLGSPTDSSHFTQVYADSAHGSPYDSTPHTIHPSSLARKLTLETIRLQGGKSKSNEAHSFGISAYIPATVASLYFIALLSAVVGISCQNQDPRECSFTSMETFSYILNFMPQRTIFLYGIWCFTPLYIFAVLIPVGAWFQARLKQRAKAACLLHLLSGAQAFLGVGFLVLLNLSAVIHQEDSGSLHNAVVITALTVQTAWVFVVICMLFVHLPPNFVDRIFFLIRVFYALILVWLMLMSLLLFLRAYKESYEEDPFWNSNSFALFSLTNLYWAALAPLFLWRELLPASWRVVSRTCPLEDRGTIALMFFPLGRHAFVFHMKSADTWSVKKLSCHGPCGWLL